ncbi:MAG: hypothetical protein IT181_08150, partial [Acidobacteria bacterium]|nr:hypothetical protein [Acidobacteriota bacterium]
MTHSAASRFRFPLLLVLLVLPISALLASAYHNQPGAATVTLHPDERYQTIHGWEAVAQASLSYLKDFDNKQEVLDELLDKAVDLGLTRVRLEVRSSAENTRDIVSEYLAGKVSRDEMRCGRYATVNDNDDPNSRRAGGFIFDSFDAEVRDTVLPLKRRLEARGEK